MTREDWRGHLRGATGPLALDRLEELRPEPELVELLRALALPPWPGSTGTGAHAVDLLAPAMAVLLLGLLGDAGSVTAIIEGLHQAEVEEFDWYREAAVPALANIGPAAAWPLREEIVRVEIEPQRDPSPPFYYWALVDAYAAVARTHATERAEFVRFALERITNRDMDPTTPNTTSYSLIWAGANQGLDLPELASAIEELFDRLGDGFTDPFLGDRARYLAHVSPDRRVDYRGRLIAWYGELYRHATETAAARDFDHDAYARVFGEDWYMEDEGEEKSED